MNPRDTVTFPKSDQQSFDFLASLVTFMERNNEKGQGNKVTNQWMHPCDEKSNKGKGMVEPPWVL